MKHKTRQTTQVIVPISRCVDVSISLLQCGHVVRTGDSLNVCTINVGCDVTTTWVMCCGWEG
jgi:hypothetical protein